MKKKVVVVGAVESTLELIKILHTQNGIDLHVFCQQYSSTISGYAHIKEFCTLNNIAYTVFKNINQHVEQVVNCRPDYLFIVGLSQLVNAEIINSSKFYSIGFHPTLLPSGRGRAPIAHVLLGNAKPGITFFILTDEADSGDIIIQQEICLSESETVESYYSKILDSVRNCKDSICEMVLYDKLKLTAQNNNAATYLGIRKPEDSEIDWSSNRNEIVKQVNASGHPYPNAFSYFCMQKIEFSSATPCSKVWYGISGRVLQTAPESITVMCNDGAVSLAVVPTNSPSTFKVGERFISSLEYRIKKLEG